MWIIFEGLDKSGKTTLEWELLKATNYKHVVIDRGPIGYKVFDKIFNRSTKLGDEQFIHQARKCMKSKDFLVVYCYCDKNVADKRLELFKEYCTYDYKKSQTLYLHNIKRYYKSEKTLFIDTTSKTVNECIEEICNKILEVSKNEL